MSSHHHLSGRGFLDQRGTRSLQCRTCLPCRNSFMNSQGRQAPARATNILSRLHPTRGRSARMLTMTYSRLHLALIPIGKQIARVPRQVTPSYKLSNVAHLPLRPMAISPCPIPTESTQGVYNLPFSQRPLLVGIEVNPGPAKPQGQPAKKTKSDTIQNDTANAPSQKVSKGKGSDKPPSDTANAPTPKPSKPHSRSSSASTSSSVASKRVWYTFATPDGQPSNMPRRISAISDKADPRVCVLLTAFSQTISIREDEVASAHAYANEYKEASVLEIAMNCCFRYFCAGGPGLPNPAVFTAFSMPGLALSIHEMVQFHTRARGLNSLGEWPIVVVPVCYDCPVEQRKKLTYNGRVIRLMWDLGPSNVQQQSVIISPTCIICEPPNSFPVVLFPRGRLWFRTVSTKEGESFTTIIKSCPSNLSALKHVTLIMFARIIHEEQLHPQHNPQASQHTNPTPHVSTPDQPLSQPQPTAPTYNNFQDLTEALSGRFKPFVPLTGNRVHPHTHIQASTTHAPSHVAVNDHHDNMHRDLQAAHHTREKARTKKMEEARHKADIVVVEGEGINSNATNTTNDSTATTLADI
eukprot:GILI01001832.1.p1 GENE.GILI01001832.1~~GILI01001832.1.p1  ORF type:complete len:608 (+),score=34.75 GILI01001832.1:82-1824(+)